MFPVIPSSTSNFCILVPSDNPLMEQSARGAGTRARGCGRELLRREAGIVPVEWLPQIEVLEREGQFVVRADLPGLVKDDVKVEVTDDLLTIQGDRTRRRRRNAKGTATASAATGASSVASHCRLAPRLPRRPRSSATGYSRSPCLPRRSLGRRYDAPRSEQGSSGLDPVGPGGIWPERDPMRLRGDDGDSIPRP